MHYIRRILGIPSFKAPLMNLQFSRTMATMTEAFQKAQKDVQQLPEDPGNEAKLKLYALFKQGTAGPVSTKRPGMLDMVGRVKWDAWNALGNISKEEAQEQYVQFVQSLMDQYSSTSAGPEPGSAAGDYKCIEVSTVEGLNMIKFNRPTKMNALTYEMYGEIVDALEKAAKDEKVVVTVTTGAGDYYCSGNDLSNFTKVDPTNIAGVAEEARKVLLKFVNAFICFPKPLIAMVNGPAIGISVTVLGMYDAVYASDKATFYTPFSILGQSPEGCSSYIFPRVMGFPKSSEMLLFNRRITAAEACDWGLVTRVFPHGTFHQEVSQIVKNYASLPKQSLWKSKQLSRKWSLETLQEVNKAECDVLKERWQSPECAQAIMDFFSRKSKM
ncbi:unnamed protein product [Darwinula stevensoni]|uniref:ACB domain-containing protein n=1 Tax=Darwinula stevensoni TaxID=69355 RepID=A0A7R9A7Z7_9CRUS|nr:unnamed protein product [Darwinula stevensoni]CAG0895817.1 unnamed protein product [Darwinula stevensoni]